MEPAGGAGSAQRGAQCLGIAVDLRSLLRREGWHQGCGTEGLGFCGTGRVPPQTGRFLCVCFSQEQRNLPGLFLASFLVLSSPFSLSFPRPFPCNLLALSLVLSLPRLYANHRILKDSGRGCRALASHPLLYPGLSLSPRSGGHRDLVAAGTQRVSLQARRGLRFLLQTAQKLSRFFKKTALAAQPDPPRTKPRC